MPYREPEYRWRRRKEAEENQRYADREWDEAAQKRYNEEIITAIKGIEEKLDRTADESAPKNKGERRRHKWEIAGLWAAAAVGVTAIYVGNRDASGQLDTMQGQLRQMESQQAMTKTIIAAHISPSAVVPFYYSTSIKNGGVVGWVINPQFKNTGATDALGYSQWWKLDVVPGPPREGDQCPAHPDQKMGAPLIVSGGQEITLAAQLLSVDDANRAKTNSVGIYVEGHIQYRDIFPDTPLHRYDWCAFVVPDDQGRLSFVEIKTKAD